MNWKMKGSLLVTLVVLFCVEWTNSEIIKIGGLFDNRNAEDAETVFRYAVEIANTEMLGTSGNRLEAGWARVPEGDVAAVSKRACKMLKNGIAAMIGPQSAESALHVQSICDAKEMPYIETRWDPVTKMSPLSVHPDPLTLGMVFVDLVKAFEWKSFTVLFENAPFIPGLANLLKLYDPKGYTVTLRQLDLGLNNNYRSVLRRVKLSADIHIIIDCSLAILPEVLKQAQQVGLMTDYHKFIVTTPDLHTLDLEPFQYSGSNITGIRLIDPEDFRVRQISDFWQYKHKMRGLLMPPGLAPLNISTDLALISDSVILFAEALRQLNGSRQLRPTMLSCDDDLTWGHGYSIVNYMKTSQVRGLTGEIRFDAKGHRTDFTVQLIELGPSGVYKIGTWNSTVGLNFTRQYEVAASEIDYSSLKNKTFVVLTALSAPYGMLKESAAQLSGNDRFEGFGIDLIYELSQMLGFNYTFRIQEDGVYGSLVNGQWNGMVKELLEHRADLAITDLTITSERESAVDFTMPFMNLGISILYRKPTKEPPSLLSFMSPFSNGVWCCVGAAYVGVSVCLFILGRISPGEWDNPYPCIEEPTVLINQFRMCNCFWSTIGVLLQQGTDVAAKAPSSRTVASIWSFFTLIMVSSYTANLAAFLTVESLVSPISSAEDLANLNGKIKYGAKRDGSTISFFREGDYPTYQKMWQFMSSHPEYLTSSNIQGVERVKTENYAFLMESTSIEYTKERECDVTQVGGLLDDKGYGIAMRKNSEYRGALSEAVLRLQEQGKLSVNKIKWWKEKRGGGACDSKSNDDGAEHLDMANVGGVFFVLLCGCGIGVAYGLCEWYYYMRKRARQKKIAFREEFKKEARFVLDVHNNTRKLRESEDEFDSADGDSSKEA